MNKQPKSKLWNNLRFWAACQVHNPHYSLPFIWYDQLRFISNGADPWRRVINDKTNLVIEGFPSSANSFLVRTLRQIVPEGFRHSDHQHSAAMVVKAIKREVPTILCLRDPISISASCAARWPMLSMEGYLERYIKWHEPLLPYVDEMIIAPFEVITKNPLLVLGAANKQYDLKLPLKDSKIDWEQAEQPGFDREKLEAKKKASSQEKQSIINEFNQSGKQELVTQAMETYNQILGAKGTLSL